VLWEWRRVVMEYLRGLKAARAPGPGGMDALYARGGPPPLAQPSLAPRRRP
jgi:hypothetical protein